MRIEQECGLMAGRASGGGLRKEGGGGATRTSC